MKKLVKISPLPWDIDFDDDGSWTLAATGFTVAHDNMDDAEKNPEISYANGEFIARAANNHNEIFDVLKALCEQFESTPNKDAVLVAWKLIKRGIKVIAKIEGRPKQ